MPDTELSQDLIEGVAAIAAHLYGTADKKKVRRTRYLIERKAIRTFRLGGIICARRSTIAADIEAAERTG